MARGCIKHSQGCVTGKALVGQIGSFVFGLLIWEMRQFNLEKMSNQLSSEWIGHLCEAAPWKSIVFTAVKLISEVVYSNLFGQKSPSAVKHNGFKPSHFPISSPLQKSVMCYNFSSQVDLLNQYLMPTSSWDPLVLQMFFTQ